MTPASSGLVPQMSKIRCSETWAWVEGNFVFHLFSSSFLKYVAFVKTNSEKNETKKTNENQLGQRCGIFTQNPRISVLNPKWYFSKNVIFRKESAACLPAFPLEDCTVEKKTIRITIGFFGIMAFFEVHVYMIWNISFKKVYHLFEKGWIFPKHSNIISNFKLDFVRV